MNRNEMKRKEKKREEEKKKRKEKYMVDVVALWWMRCVVFRLLDFADDV